MTMPEKLEDYPFRRQELLEDRDTLLQQEIPPLEEALHEAEAALERARTAPLDTIPRRECKRMCNPCRIKDGRLDCAATKSRECVFAVEFAAFRAGTPDTPSPAEEYKAIPSPDAIRAGLVKTASRNVESLRKKLAPLYARLEQIQAELKELDAST
ncbi:hypothetical protein SAMN05660284_02194 [Formivibrio citricus]|uniref:Uncharacterized protein n=1 Tax=Formivibrio citricus TaxID=83765 RepID=A0A1I5BKJ5_9NEIS|nr:hypothetical protein [Formivibrio citricus]SFN75285.1 hypothetical protein SAMN05660284_02194 [Formivibrio citricus]